MRLVRICVIAGLVSSLPACTLFQPRIQEVVVDASCQSFRPIYLTENDIHVISDQAIIDISTHNEVGARKCGW